MRKPARKLLIRADAGTRIGSGHVMRCLALAQGWQRAGGEAVFAQAETTPALQARLEREGCAVVALPAAASAGQDAAATVAAAEVAGAEWIVADGYGFDATWQADVRAHGRRLAVLDDFGHAERYSAELILNQNVSADEGWYARREPGCRLALGARYAMLRREFLDWGGAAREVPAVARRVLVTLGGSDADNVTARVIENLRVLPGIEATVVIGGLNPHLAALEVLAAACNRERAWLRLVVNATNMPELMARADVAIAAGGSTLWELAFMGLPALVLVLADNQAPAVRVLAAEGIVCPLADAGEIPAVLAALLPDAPRRRAMSGRARALVDGRGVERVIARMEEAV